MTAIWRQSFWIWGSPDSPHRWAVNQRIEYRPPIRLFALASYAGVLVLPNLDWLPGSDRRIPQHPSWHQHKGHVGETINEDMETGGMFLALSFPDGRQWEPGTKEWPLHQGDFGRWEMQQRWDPQESSRNCSWGGIRIMRKGWRPEKPPSILPEVAVLPISSMLPPSPFHFL